VSINPKHHEYFQTLVDGLKHMINILDPEPADIAFAVTMASVSLCRMLGMTKQTFRNNIEAMWDYEHAEEFDRLIWFESGEGPEDDDKDEEDDGKDDKGKAN